jgi:hypothetical protein
MGFSPGDFSITALKRRSKSNFYRSAEALLPPHKCGAPTEKYPLNRIPIRQVPDPFGRLLAKGWEKTFGERVVPQAPVIQGPILCDQFAAWTFPAVECERVAL